MSLANALTIRNFVINRAHQRHSLCLLLHIFTPWMVPKQWANRGLEENNANTVRRNCYRFLRQPATIMRHFADFAKTIDPRGWPLMKSLKHLSKNWFHQKISLDHFVWEFSISRKMPTHKIERKLLYLGRENYSKYKDKYVYFCIYTSVSIIVSPITYFFYSAKRFTFYKSVILYQLL